MSMALNGLSILIGAFTLVALVSDEAHPKTLEEVLVEISEARSSVRTLRADFVQDKVVDLFSSSIRSAGRVIMRPPELMVWKVLEPLEAFYFIYRGTVGSRDPHTGEVKRWNMSQSPEAKSTYEWLQRVFMGSIDDLKQSAHIEMLEDNARLLRLRLVPRDMGSASIISEVELWFDSSTLHLREITFRETTGDHTRIRLENIEANKDIRNEIPTWLQGEDDQ